MEQYTPKSHPLLSNLDEISAKVNAIRQLKNKTGYNAYQQSSRISGSVVVDFKDERSMPLHEKSLLQKMVRTTLVNSKHDIEIQRRDPSSPLFSIKSFEELHLKPELLKGVYMMGFNSPSKIQETAVPTLLADPPQNMIAQAQSGTGKTAAFALAMLSRVDPSIPYAQALCLSPTYELAIQTGEVVSKMSMFCPEIEIKYALRGEERPTGREHIIIGTPGKVVDWCVKYKFIDLTKLTVFILDEADVMIDTQGHQAQSLRIRKFLPPHCQMMLFSATYDAEVMQFAEMMVPNAVTIRLRREEESLHNIKQYYVKCRDSDEKYKAMTNIYGISTVGQFIIFCQTRRTALWLSGNLTKDGHKVALLTGDLTIDERIHIFDKFREGEYRVLIATNVLARGIDIEQVTMVVNWDLPVDQMGNADCETYLHRIGRTGRFGRLGFAINLIESEDKLQIMLEIQRHFGIMITRLNTETEDLENLHDTFF